jgi:hypothetical protein
MPRRQAGKLAFELGFYRVRRGTRSPLVVVHPRIGDLSPAQANTTRAGRARNPQAERGGSTGPPGRSSRVTCGNEDGQPEWSRRPGPDRGSRFTALDHQGSTVTASRCCPAVPAPQPQSRTPARMTVPPSLNPHETELTPIRQSPAASRTRARSRRCPRARSRARRLAIWRRRKPVVTPPAIRRARDVPLPTLAGPAHVTR